MRDYVFVNFVRVKKSRNNKSIVITNKIKFFTFFYINTSSHSILSDVWWLADATAVKLIP